MINQKALVIEGENTPIITKENTYWCNRIIIHAPVDNYTLTFYEYVSMADAWVRLPIIGGVVYDISENIYNYNDQKISYDHITQPIINQDVDNQALVLLTFSSFSYQITSKDIIIWVVSIVGSPQGNETVGTEYPGWGYEIGCAQNNTILQLQKQTCTSHYVATDLINITLDGDEWPINQYFSLEDGSNITNQLVQGYSEHEIWLTM